MTASDDDGEAYAGKKLERVLEGLGAQGAVVVARWFGGVMLGPVRFAHFEAVAREAVGLWRDSERDEVTTRGGKDMVGGVKRAKPDGDDSSVKRERLAQQLEERDQSIVVLRGLLAEKTIGGGSQISNLSSSSSAKASNYTNMMLDQLEKLEKARDATIAWLLKKIEAAEKVVGRDDEEIQDDDKVTAKRDQLGSIPREVEAPEETVHPLMHREATAEDHG